MEQPFLHGLSSFVDLTGEWRCGMSTAAHFIKKILHSHTAILVKQFLVRTKYWCTLFLPAALDFTVHICCPTDWLLVL